MSIKQKQKKNTKWTCILTENSTISENFSLQCPVVLIITYCLEVKTKKKCKWHGNFYHRSSSFFCNPLTQTRCMGEYLFLLILIVIITFPVGSIFLNFISIFLKTSSLFKSSVSLSVIVGGTKYLSSCTRFTFISKPFCFSLTRTIFLVLINRHHNLSVELSSPT